MSGLTKVEFQERVAHLRTLAATAGSEEEMRAVTSRIAQISRQFRVQTGVGLPQSPLAQAQELDPGFSERPHLTYLSNAVTRAVRNVERGQNQMLAVSMPPRAGKSTLVSYYTPLWLLRRHPEWGTIMTSYDGGLTTEWARNIRNVVEDNPNLGVPLRKDGGAGGRWKTVDGGGIYATATSGMITGRGARVFIIDDPVKDFVEAHSERKRQALWDWWLSVAQTRLEGPYLVLVVMTRWHEDDFVGRLFNPDYEGDPKQWSRISFPAIAEENDKLGRAPGEPLLSPLQDESPSKALQRWDDIKTNVGSYTFASMYQQRPAPAKGAIFDSGWWKFWTRDPEQATEDGRVVYLEPTSLSNDRWIDSWDMTFKGGEGSDWVVGQRWVRHQANRYLILQARGRWSFTQTLDRMRAWARPNDPANNPYGHMVHERIIESTANGPAILDTLKNEISGLKPVNPKTSKEARARAITPEVESGNVYLPHPSDPGNGWVQDLLSELRNFPHDTHDDQVDALTQALSALRDHGKGKITSPNSRRLNRGTGPGGVTQTARATMGQPRGYTRGR